MIKDLAYGKGGDEAGGSGAGLWSEGQSRLEKNLAAWRAWSAWAADEVGAVTVGEHIRLVRARDGTASFRIGQEDGRRPWLGYTSVPSIVAATVAGKVDYRRGNLIVKGLGSGAEVAGMLERMPPYQAAFVVESDPLWLNLAFRLRDYSEALRSGRLVVLLGEDVVELLVRFYGEHPGYNPVEQTVMWAWLSERENHAFGGGVAAAMQGVQGSVGEQSSGSAAGVAGVEPGGLVAKLASPERLRVANFTRVYGLNDCCTSRDALAGLAGLGVVTDHLVLDRPGVVSYEAHRERLAGFGADLLLLVDMTRAEVPADLAGGMACVTLVRQLGPGVLGGAGALGPRDYVFAATREQVGVLLESGYPEGRVLHLPLGANTTLFEPVVLEPEAAADFGSDVAVVGHRPSIDPEDYQIKLSSHQQLWQAVIAEIRRGAGGYCRESAGRVLRRAQRCGVEVQSDDLRLFLTELIEGSLGEAVVADVYCGALRRAQVDLRIWQSPGRFGAEASALRGSWSASPVGELAAGTAGEGEAMNRLYNSSKIFVRMSTAGGVDRMLLDGMAAGAFFLVKSHPSDRRKDGLGEMFKLGEELVTFETPEDLVKKVGYYLEHSAEREAVAARGRERVVAEHSYSVRMAGMLEGVRRGLSGG